VKRFLLAVGLLAGSAAAVHADAAAFPFSVGEKLTYQVYWGPLPVGQASLEVRNIEPVDGHDCYHFVAVAWTTGLGELLFPVKNTVESWLDVEGLFSRKYKEARCEGKARHDDEINYDYQHGRAVIRNVSKGTEKVVPLERPVLDIISLLYYVRTRPLLLDAEQDFLLNVGVSNVNVSVTADQRSTISVKPIGRIEALRLQPKPTLKIIAHNKGRMWFWVGDNDQHLPLQMVSQMPIGSAQLVLDKIETINAAPGAVLAARPTNACPSAIAPRTADKD
jgi:hypothetical protein